MIGTSFVPISAVCSENIEELRIRIVPVCDGNFYSVERAAICFAMRAGWREEGEYDCPGQLRGREAGPVRGVKRGRAEQAVQMMHVF